MIWCCNKAAAMTVCHYDQVYVWCFMQDTAGLNDKIWIYGDGFWCVEFGNIF
jgi:hypothetical protein